MRAGKREYVVMINKTCRRVNIDELPKGPMPAYNKTILMVNKMPIIRNTPDRALREALPSLRLSHKNHEHSSNINAAI